MVREELAASKMSSGGRTQFVPPFSLVLSVQVSPDFKVGFFYQINSKLQPVVPEFSLYFTIICGLSFMWVMHSVVQLNMN